MMNRLVGSISLLAVMAWGVAGAAAEGTWAERLGYPAGQRILILHANDMGGLYELNHCGQTLLSAGKLQSVGVMPPAPWFHEFAGWCQEHPGYDVGVSFTLTCPSEIYRWRSVTAADQVCSLLDPDGYFWGKVEQVSENAEAADVERELQSQIDLARKAGIEPTHLMTFEAALFSRFDLLKVYLDTAQKNGIPAVVFELTPALEQELMQSERLNTVDIRKLRDLLSSYTLPKIDRIDLVPDGESYEETREGFRKLIRGLPAGITQVLVSPADRSPSLERVSPRWNHRVWDAQLLADPEVARFLKDEGVAFTTWREIMDRFKKSSGSSSAASKAD